MAQLGSQRTGGAGETEAGRSIRGGDVTEPIPMVPKEIALEAKLASYFGAPDADPHLRAAESFSMSLLREFFKAGGPDGDCLPWPKTSFTVRLRTGEVSLWPGINGHGKSLLTSQVALGLVAQGRRVVIASLEMPPVKTLRRMARQAIGNGTPTKEAIAQFIVSQSC